MDMLADMLTKPLTRVMLQRHRAMFGIVWFFSSSFLFLFLSFYALSWVLFPYLSQVIVSSCVLVDLTSFPYHLGSIVFFFLFFLKGPQLCARGGVELTYSVLDNCSYTVCVMLCDISLSLSHLVWSSVVYDGFLITPLSCFRWDPFLSLSLSLSSLFLSLLSFSL